MKKTHCRHGHHLDDQNTYVDPRGWRGCRSCRYDAVLKYRNNK